MTVVELCCFRSFLNFHYNMYIPNRVDYIYNIIYLYVDVPKYLQFDDGDGDDVFVSRQTHPRIIVFCPEEGAAEVKTKLITKRRKPFSRPHPLTKPPRYYCRPPFGLQDTFVYIHIYIYIYIISLNYL
jgi:hypothetical protein